MIPGAPEDCCREDEMDMRQLGFDDKTRKKTIQMVKVRQADVMKRQKNLLTFHSFSFIMGVQ